MCFYLEPDNETPELQLCLAEVLYDVSSIATDPEGHTKEERATLYDHIAANLERAWELSGGSEGELDSMALLVAEAASRQATMRTWL
ncbi:MAG: hypothetical protein OES46_19770 [Gammaproteobacteria bacterium]|jgi:hypothetical protein|nr:hypothetical protein [Gammaproteobacteria bacterium]